MAIVINRQTSHLEAMRWLDKGLLTVHPPFKESVIHKLYKEDAMLVIGASEIDDITIEDLKWMLTNQHDASSGKKRDEVKS